MIRLGRRAWVTGLAAAALASIRGPREHPAPHEPRRPLRPPVGVAVGLYPRAAAHFGLPWPPDLTDVAALGSRTVWLPVSWSQRALRGAPLAPDADTVTDADLVTLCRQAHALGLDVVLCPLVELRGADASVWRGRIQPDAGSVWWASYERFLLRYATLAERERVAGLVVTHELSGLSGPDMAPRWRALAARVRQAFGGAILAVVNHDALGARLPWEAFDRVGVSAYFSLSTDPDATEETLVVGWSRAAARLETFAERVARSVFIAEVGYPSLDGAAIAPWDVTLGAPVDLEEQRRCFAALERNLPLMPSIDGLIVWAWLGAGGRHDRWYTPRGKPAEEVVRRILSAARSRST